TYLGNARRRSPTCGVSGGRRPYGWWSIGVGARDPADAAEPGGAVEIAHPQDGRPGRAAVVLHGVEVHPPGAPGQRRRVRRFGERRPGDLRLDRVALVDVGVVVDRAVDDHHAREVGAPLLVAEGPAAVAVWGVVVVVLRVEDEVLRVDLDLVVVL